MDHEQFDMMPKIARPLLEKLGGGWGSIHIVPIESGRGCPYGCEFCTVTGFFGDSIRFRSNESVVNELLRLKRHARANRKQVIVFFIDDEEQAPPPLVLPFTCRSPKSELPKP